MKMLTAALVLGLVLSLSGASSVEAKPKKGKPPAVKVVKETNQSLTPAKPAKKQPKVQRPVTPKVVCLRNPAVPEGRLDITERICQAKRLLANRVADAGYCTKTTMKCRGKGKRQKCREVTTSSFCRRSILIAAMDPKGNIKVIEVDAQTGKSETAGYTVQLSVRDGVDSEYDVRVPPGQLVVGMQFPLQMKTARGLIIERALYTPYTRELREAYPELVTLGWSYLNDGLSEARQKIEESGVSLDDIDPRAVFTLVMIEHFSNEELSDARVEEEMYRVALTLGANGGAAYKYSVSSAEARGIGQFMPKTWAALRSRYSQLLNMEFFSGSTSHPQAFIAQYLLAKEDLKYLLGQRGWRGESMRIWTFLSDPRQVGEFLALAYNGGGPRAHRWLESNRKMTIPLEGVKYIRKFNQVWSVLERLQTN
ncbi:MAG: hypothetical protein NTU97_00850 [Candidatus Magasanikbacteria bacterium]|nr:hypothetical protein [Candidatus Magasanikbacteria bacterium]